MPYKDKEGNLRYNIGGAKVIEAKPDPTFDNPQGHGKPAPIPSTGMGGLAKDYEPQPERAKRREFGVSQGDQK